MKIPLLIEPKAGESARGFFLRLAERHGISHAMMCEWLKLPPPESQPDACPARAADPVGVDADTLTRMGFDGGETVHVLGTTMPKSSVRTQDYRACPACLHERPYHHRCRELRHVENCPIGRTPLLPGAPIPTATWNCAGRGGR